MGGVPNANANHCMKTTYSMDWNEATVVDRSSRWRVRKINVSVYIRTRKTYNMDLGSPFIVLCGTL